MNSDQQKNKGSSMGKQKVYIFGVTFLACFVGALICWPTKQPVYQSRAIVAIEHEDGSTLDGKNLAARLRTASREVLSTDSLINLCNHVSTPLDASDLLQADQVDRLRSSLQVGVGKGTNNSQQLISLTLHGKGTVDEIEFLNSFADSLVNELRAGEINLHQQTNADEIRSQFQISQARVQGLRNAASLIAAQQTERLGMIRQIELETGKSGLQQINNPTRATYQNRLRELISQQETSRRMSGGASSFELLLESTRVAEEIRVLKSQLAVEPKTIGFDVQQISQAAAEQPESETAPLPVVRSDFNSDLPDGPAVRHNEFFAQPTEEPAKLAITGSRVELVDHQQLISTQETITRINAEIRSEENRQNRMQATLVSDVSQARKVGSTEVVRLFRPATDSRPTGAGITQSQFLMMLTISTLFGLGIAIAARPESGGGVFRTPEEVSRKLGITVIGTVPVAQGDDRSSDSGIDRSHLIRRTVLACELLLIAFAVVMLATTVMHSEIAISVRQNPVAGMMEAIRTIKPW